VKRWKLILGLSVLFLSGVLIGSMGAAIYFKQTFGHGFPKEQSQVRKLVMKKLVRELDLTEVQRTPIEDIVGQVQTNLWKFRKQHKQEVEAIIVQGIVQMKPLLNPIQQEKLDDLFQRYQAHWERPPEGHRR
jgi:Spy/CpxP family protein refolding chaperone